jgi:hypothetical protein
MMMLFNKLFYWNDKAREDEEIKKTSIKNEMKEKKAWKNKYHNLFSEHQKILDSLDDINKLLTAKNALISDIGQMTSMICKNNLSPHRLVTIEIIDEENIEVPLFKNFITTINQLSQSTEKNIKSISYNKAGYFEFTFENSETPITFDKLINRLDLDYVDIIAVCYLPITNTNWFISYSDDI